MVYMYWWIICRRKWQGDPQVLIDRFDARAHLDFIAEVKKDGDDQRSIFFYFYSCDVYLFINAYVRMR